MAPQKIMLALRNGVRIISGTLLWTALVIRTNGQIPPPAALTPVSIDSNDTRSAIQLFLSDAGARYPGSPGNLAIEAKVAARFAASGFTNGAIRFVAPALKPGAGRVIVDGMAPFTIKTLHPTLMRPGNFPATNFFTRLVYLGHGTLEDLRTVEGIDLSGTVAVLDEASGKNWLRLMRFGVKGFLFIAESDESGEDSFEKMTSSEVAIPRYYVNPTDGVHLRDILRKGMRPARIETEPTRWERTILRDLWVLIPGSDPSFEKEVVAFVAPMDANSVVPEMAEGGQAGANLYLLMKLLDRFTRTPPARSVLLVAVNARTQSFLGERMLAWNLLAPSAEIDKVRTLLASYVRYEEMLTNVYSQVDLGTPNKAAEDYLIAMRTREDKSTGRNLTVKTPLVARIKRDMNQVKAELLKLQKMKPTPALGDQQRQLNVHLQQYVNLLTLFNKAGIQTILGQLSATELGMLRNYFTTILDENRLWMKLNRADLQRDIDNGNIRQALGRRACAFVITLDCTFTTPTIGFCGIDVDNTAVNWGRGFGANSARIAASLTNSIGGLQFNPMADTMTSAGGLSQEHYFIVNQSCIGFFHAAAVPAFSLRNVYATTGRAFTPYDTVAHLDATNIRMIDTYLPAYFQALLNDRQLTDESELPPPVPESKIWASQIRTYEFDPFSASVVPDQAVANSLVVLYSAKTMSRIFIDGEVLSGMPFMTDERAIALYYGLKGKGSAQCLTYRLKDDAVTVDRVIDAGEAQAKVSAEIIPGERVVPLFPCREIVLYDRTDASQASTTGIELSSYLLLNAAQNVVPRRYGTSGISIAGSARKFSPILTGPGAIYIEHGERVKIMDAGKRCVLNVTPEHPEGYGVATTEELGADFFLRVAGDLSQLNRHRLRNFRGVSDELVDIFLKRGAAAYARAKSQLSANHHIEYLKDIYEALGAEAKAYANISGVRNDMLKAVVFYMALLLPFCFFVQRLIFKTTRIEFQMGLFAAIFILTFLVFRFIHPAFRVAQSPEAIFIAFVMGGLGLFVISILHGRFEGEMLLIFSTLTNLESAQIGYSTASQQAMLIGVNNMKRRRLRTALTTATIVLVTFTMLAFTSVSRKMSPTIIPISREAPYTGIFFQWPGSMRMDESTLNVFQALFNGDADQVVVRRWLMPRAEEGALPLFRVESSNGVTAQIEAILGLSKADDGFLAPMPILKGGRFFSSNSALEVVLPARTAEVLKISPAEVGHATIIFRDLVLTVVGIVNDERFVTMMDLNNHTLLPIKAIQTQGFNQSQEQASAMIDPTATEETGVFYADLAAMLIFPVDLARKLGGEAYSVSVRLKPDFALWRAIDRLLISTSAKFYIGSQAPFPVVNDSKRLSPAGIYYVGSGYHTSVGGLTRLIIPLLIAATIILNTMLGSVYERKSEISVYNAVGLNPTHIGMFFLAEAFVYSVIGSIGGYLIGQILTLGLVHFNLVRDINLNFSSLSVVYVILFTILVVLLSTLYPAIVASRASVPSGKRKWSMPPHDGHQMDVVFPFIYDAAAVPGLMAYIEEYFIRFTEASIGELIASCNGHRSGRDEQGRVFYELSYDIALAPYDLGVTQKVVFRAAMNDVVKNYGIRMIITRVSGQDSNWVTTNKPYLERLRKYLMNWRNLTQSRREEYIVAGLTKVEDAE